MAQQEIKIALCGAGNVGGAVLELLTVNADFYKKMFDTDFLVSDVVTKSGKLRGYKDKFNGNIHTDFESIINNDSIDVVIEVMGGIDDAYKVAKQALESKKDFITANKAMMSLHGDELFKLAEKNNLFIGFEASVAGGIPIIRSLSSKARIENISWFAGILNGTSNYILSKMESDGIELKEGVKQAQELGFAEADPTLDLNGTDAAQKGKVLSYLAFGSKLDSSIELDIEGIDIVESIDFKFALELGYSIKPLSIGSYEKNRLILKSFPALIQQSSILSKVNEEMNAIEVFTKDSGSNLFYGPGAGPKPTASSILSDLFDIAQNIKVNYSKFGQGLMEISNNTFSCQRYLRLEVNDSPGVMAKISSFIAKQNLSIESVIQKEDFSQDGLIPIVIVLNECNENELEDLLNSFSKEKDLFKKIVHLRIFNPNK